MTDLACCLVKSILCHNSRLYFVPSSLLNKTNKPCLYLSRKPSRGLAIWLIVGDIYVTSFSSISYYNNVRLISKQHFHRSWLSEKKSRHLIQVTTVNGLRHASGPVQSSTRYIYWIFSLIIIPEYKFVHDLGSTALKFIEGKR